MSEPTQPPEAQLIERLRTAVRPKLSIRAAARASAISDSRWHQIIKGYRQESAGLRVPVRAPADTLARMARAVGATADQLREVGREDAADELEAQAHARSARTPNADPTHRRGDSPSTEPSSGGQVAKNHPILTDGASIPEVAGRLEGILDTMDAMLATQHKINELTMGLPAATGDDPGFPDKSELGQAIQDALTADAEFREFLADLLFQLITTASASNATEIRALIRPLYDRAVKGIPAEWKSDEEDSSFRGKQNPGLHRVTNSRSDRDLPGTDAGANTSETGSNITGSGDQVPSDTAAAGMTDAELRKAAQTDPLWADYVKTKRPELILDF